MSLLDVIGLVVLAVLVGYLCRRHEERICRRPLKYSDTGKFFDATSARDRVARVRQNHLAVVCSRSRDRTRRNRLLAQVCLTVRGRSYFRRVSGANAPAAQAEAEHRPD